LSANKPRGLCAARKLRTDRKDARWADKSYKKRALGNIYKTSPTGGSSHAKGIVLEKIGIESKQPNSAIRKCVRVQLIKNGKKVTAFVPNDGCLNYLDENDEVLISGFGRRGKAKGDIPGVRFKVVKVSGVGLMALWKEKKVRSSSLPSLLHLSSRLSPSNPSSRADILLLLLFVFFPFIRRSPVRKQFARPGGFVSRRRWNDDGSWSSHAMILTFSMTFTRTPSIPGSSRESEREWWS
ncbi:ribosomal protein S12/S23-domain-containing protein, partial [Mrakia frigida]|uniref:40S ribosomal protein S23 n=1 Tax=Mrakia frigida TaxID=29902 RepID=UPI003FCC113F